MKSFPIMGEIPDAGRTGLTGTNFVAQAYAGPSPTDLHPVGLVRPFQSGLTAGVFLPVFVTLADVVVLQTAYVQVRVWERGMGETYEAARARGGALRLFRDPNGSLRGGYLFLAGRRYPRRSYFNPAQSAVRPASRSSPRVG